jgi:hypothetical protein
MKYIVKGEGTPITYFTEDKAKEHARARREQGVLAYYVVVDEPSDDSDNRCDSFSIPAHMVYRIFGRIA